MNATYFSIVARSPQNKQLWRVDLDRLSQVARFVIDSEPFKCKSHAECTIAIQQQHVGMPSLSTVLEVFKADGAEELQRLAQDLKQ